MLHADTLRLILLAAAVFFAASSAAAQPGVSTETGENAAEIVAEMKTVWQARAERMGACRMECVETTSCCAFYGLITSGNVDRLSALRDPEELFRLMEPPLFESSTTFSLVAEGARMRKERVGERVVDEHGTLEPMHHREVPDGNLFLFLDQSAGHYSVAEIHEGRLIQTRRRGHVERDVNEIDIPAFGSLGFLYDWPGMFRSLGAWELEVRNDECQSGLVTLSTTDGNQRHYVTFDRARSYLLVNRSRYDGQNPQNSIDVRYSNETAATREWVPTGWSITQRGESGNIIYQVRADVSRLEINVETSPDEFDVSLPRGSYVQDNRPASEGFDEEWGKSTYVINDDGTVCILTGAEVRVPPRAFFD